MNIIHLLFSKNSLNLEFLTNISDLLNESHSECLKWGKAAQMSDIQLIVRPYIVFEGKLVYEPYSLASKEVL